MITGIACAFTITLISEEGAEELKCNSFLTNGINLDGSQRDLKACFFFLKGISFFFGNRRNHEGRRPAVAF